MMLYPAADPSSKSHQQPLPVKRRRGRPPKDLTAQNSPSELSNGIFTTSPLALNSAAALKLGSPETTSPLMRVSPDKRKRNSTDRVLQTGPKGKRNKFVEYTPTKPSPLSAQQEHRKSISIIPANSTTHQKLSEITAKKPPTTQQDQKMTPVKFKQPSTPNANRFVMNNNLLLSSPLTNLQQPSSFAKQHDHTSDSVYSHNNIPMTPASQFTSLIHSSPIYQNYFNESLTPLINDRKFSFDPTFSKFKFEDDEIFNPVQLTRRTNSLTVIDTIGKNISSNNRSDPLGSTSPFRQLVNSSPIRPDEFLKKSLSTPALPVVNQDSGLRAGSLHSKSSMMFGRRNLKLSLKIGSDGKASITREEQIDEIDEQLLHQPSIKATPRLTIRPSLMTLSSSPALLNKENTIDHLKSIILDDDDDSEDEGDDEDIVINKGESDARSALMRAFRRVV